MTELDLLIDFHRNAERQGPGSEADTLKALSFIDLTGLDGLKIADIGCGTGAQTLTLAKATHGQITAVDLFPAFLEKLDQRSGKSGLHDAITTLQASMDSLPFEKGEFDIIWSEGAVYNIGFENGIASWKEFLKPGGYMALSEITWTSSERPREIEAHWHVEYPQIAKASDNIRVLENQGFSIAGYFPLPKESWIDNYYAPMEERFSTFLEQHGHSREAENLVAAEREEIRLYRTYADYYSYGFYVAKKAGTLAGEM
ncbi:MAG: class I SAM-dependent methyltransferase [Spirochaetales bacterium]|nr:class I SAM-dependent methyltransferase [Spirochaetales bacterium]